jgi:TRAP transporter 4TM/12TM fusion protein
MGMGSITGSAAANAATTGSFTIPLLKRAGIDDESAAAIEAVASSGGQTLPPVMGVAAFLMAFFLETTYARVVAAALVPAMLLYLAVAVGASRLSPADGTVAPDTERSLLAGAHFLVPLIALAYALTVRNLAPLSAGLWALGALVAAVAVRDVAVGDAPIAALAASGRRTLDGLRQGAVDFAPLAGVLAAMGIVVSLLTQTGLTQRVSLWLVGAAGTSLVAVLAVAALASLLLGLGMPTPAAYVLVVVLVAPGVIRAGVAPIVAHLFVFYFALLSAITPPVAVAVAVAAELADASFLGATRRSLQLGAVAFVLPVAFVATPALVVWTAWTPALTVVAAVGLVALSLAAVSDDCRRSVRLAAAVLGLAALFGPRSLQGLAAGCLVLWGVCWRVPAVRDRLRWLIPASR